MDQRILLVLINAITILLPFATAEIDADVATETVEFEEFMHRLKTALQNATPEEQCKVRAAFEMIVTDIEEMILKNPDGNTSLLICLPYFYHIQCLYCMCSRVNRTLRQLQAAESHRETTSPSLSLSTSSTLIASLDRTEDYLVAVLINAFSINFCEYLLHLMNSTVEIEKI